MLKIIKLRRWAYDYMRDQLSQGRALSTLLQKLPLEEGSLWTWLPTDENISAREALESGGLMSRSDSVSRLVDSVRSYLEESPTHYAVFEHALAEPMDPFLQHTPCSFFTCGRDVYFYLTSRDVNPEWVKLTVEGAETYLLTGVLANLEGTRGPANHEQVTVETLERLALSAEYLVVSAYDGEGYLVWSKLDSNGVIQ